MAGDSTLETDYLVVGAGALGMAFVDSLIEHSDADVVMVERRHRPGGHWLDAYPFVQLHQPSRFYGVNSTPLGQDRIEPDGPDTGFSERASGAEICGYYDEIMRHRFLASGRVRFFPMSDYLGDRRFRSRVTDQVTDVTVRSHVVDATYMASRVPATEPAPFDVVDGVRCVPVGELAKLADPAAGYVIVGGGKTASDAICWLLDRGTDPDDITWIRPRDNWILNRAFFQPGQARTFAGVVVQLEAMVESAVGGGGVRASRSGGGDAPHRPGRRADDDEGRDGERLGGRATPSDRKRRPLGARRKHRARPDRARARINPDHSRSSPRALRRVRAERQPTATDLHRRHDHPPARDPGGPHVVRWVAGIPGIDGTDDGGEEHGSARPPSCRIRRSTTSASSWPASVPN